MKPQKIVLFLLVWGVLMLGQRLIRQQDSVYAQSAPYPNSPVITGVSFNAGTFRREAIGSDNWPITWSNDDHQYTSWGDGWGWSNQATKQSLGVSRISGDKSNYTGTDLWNGSGKSYGLISINGILYMWVSPGSGTTNYTETRLYQSANKGASWTQSSWNYTQSQDLMIPTILQFGKDYAGARDNYVYHYFIDHSPNPGEPAGTLAVQKPGIIYLARVPKDQLLSQSSYEFFAGMNSGNPTWTNSTSKSARAPVFQDANGVGWTVSVSYNFGTGRYILMTEHSLTSKGNLGIFDAPEPWGPWTTVAYFSNWQGTANTFFWNISQKWSSGSNFVLAYSGVSDYDAWNSIEGQFTTAGPSPTPQPTLTPSPSPSSLPSVSPSPSANPTPSPFGTSLMKNLHVFDSENASDWSIQSIAETGDLIYGDRTFTFLSLPPVLLGADWIRTANDSKNYTGNPLASFELTQNAKVYIAYDSRETNLPMFMSGWVATGASIETGDVPYTVYVKTVAAGVNQLGPKALPGQNSMYLVFAKPDVPGDANGDGFVDAFDFTIWINNYARTTTSAAEGDFYPDGQNNSFDFAVWREHSPLPPAGTEITILAAGNGAPNMELKIDDLTVATYPGVGGNYTQRNFVSFTYTSNLSVTVDQIKVAFTNDSTTNDLFVDKIMIDGQSFESEAPNTFSTGVYTQGACQSGGGYFQTERLACNGYFRYGDTVVSSPSPGTGTALHAAAQRHGKYFGAEIEAEAVWNGDDPMYFTVLEREYGLMVPGNDFKMRAISQSATSYDYTKPDRNINYARSINFPVHAHTLIWHKSVPDWLLNSGWSNTQVEAWFETYIKTVVARYKDDVDIWDVVNEPVYWSDSSGTWVVRDRTESFWYQKIGPSYIEKAFQWARQADPDVKLYINEYSTEWNNPKTDRLYEIVSDLKNRGFPIDGVGFQFHLNINQFPNYDQMYQSMKRFTDLGLDVSVTELDIGLNDPVTSTQLQTQATLAANVVRACLNLARCVGITTWGITDKYSWLDISSIYTAGLLFDTNYNKKPAYFSVLNELNN